VMLSQVPDTNTPKQPPHPMRQPPNTSKQDSYLLRQAANTNGICWPYKLHPWYQFTCLCHVLAWQPGLAGAQTAASEPT